MRAALYARVSTHDQQTLGLQVEATADYIKGRGWDLVRQVKDVGSGARERPGREGLLKAAGRREMCKSPKPPAHHWLLAFRSAPAASSTSSIS